MFAERRLQENINKISKILTWRQEQYETVSGVLSRREMLIFSSELGAWKILIKS